MEEDKELSPVCEESEDIACEVSEVFELFRTPHKFQPKSKGKKVSKRKHSQESPEEKVKEDKRQRTPSGQIIPKSVTDIRAQIEGKIVNFACGVQSTVKDNVNTRKCDKVKHADANHDNSECKQQHQSAGGLLSVHELDQKVLEYQRVIKAAKMPGKQDQTKVSAIIEEGVENSCR